MSGNLNLRPHWTKRLVSRLRGAPARPSLRSYGIHDHVWPQLFELELEKGRPLAVFDADDVLLDFAGHFDRYLGERGYKLTFRPGYKHTVTRLDAAETVETKISDPLVEEFFASQTRIQTAFPGAAEALKRLEAEGAQVLVLTNCPVRVREDRILNLVDQKMPVQVVANIGGKGPALKYLHDRIRAPVTFADDTPRQLASAASRAPEVRLLHFAADPWVREAAGKAESAHESPTSWPELEGLIRGHLFR